MQSQSVATSDSVRLRTTQHRLRVLTRRVKEMLQRIQVDETTKNIMLAAVNAYGAE